MARPKEFDREAALQSAKMTFWRQGYASTTTDDLRLAMGIGRQSFYDSFKSKHDVFIEILEQYNSERGTLLSKIVNKNESPLKTLELILIDIAHEDNETRALGCIGISSVCEFGVSDKKIAEANSRAGTVWKKTFEGLLVAAKASGEVRANINEKSTAIYLQTVLAGLRVAATGGTSSKELKEIVKVTVDGLKA